MTTVLVARATLRGLARSPRGLFGVAAWSAATVLVAVLFRAHVDAPADRLLRGVFGFAVLPLASFAAVRAELGPGGLRAFVRGFSLLGERPVRAALEAVAAVVATTATLGAVLALVGAALAHGPGDPPLLADLAGSVVAGVLGGAAYGALFALGSTFVRGALVGTFLGLDLVFGAGDGWPSVLVPRGHVAALLGGRACAELPVRASSVVLVALTLLYGALAVRFARRA